MIMFIVNDWSIKWARGDERMVGDDSDDKAQVLRPLGSLAMMVKVIFG